MRIILKKYIALLAIHLLIGILIFEFPDIAKFFATVIILAGLAVVIKNRNANNEVLYVSAYIVGSEVFLRMIQGNLGYEFAKYGVILFAILGLFYSGFTKKSGMYFVFLVLLVPGIFIGTNSLESHVRAKIMFDFSGPLCLGIASVYTFRRKITANVLNQILLAIVLPLVSCCTYLFLITPNVSLLHFNTESNFALSGGFGPNQLATIFGLGMIILISQMLGKSVAWVHFVLNLLLLDYIFYRGILTFSRGGMFTGLAISFVVICFACCSLEKPMLKVRLFKIGTVVINLAAVFVLTSYQSKGVVEKRYANKDMHGKIRSNKPTGRLKVTLGEIDMFRQNPIFGKGIGRGKEIRGKILGKVTSTHNELTRMLAEHGIFGLAALLLLIGVPIFLYFGPMQNRYLVFFFLFWLLTVSHSGMRIAAPAFIYALALLNVQPEKVKVVSGPDAQHMP